MRAAIKKEFDRVYDALGEGERDHALQRAIKSKVVYVVDFCQAQQSWDEQIEEFISPTM